MVTADGEVGVRRASRSQRRGRAPAAGRLALARGRAVLRRDPRPTRWAWPAGAATAGRAAGSPTTGTRCSPPTGSRAHAALDDQSAFIASLGSSRSPRMRDVLGTIQADQDAIIRAGSRGALVVDGGPGTGKTVVALHRAAYLLYADPRLGDAARRRAVRRAAPALPRLRRRRAAEPRRGGRADLHPARPGARGRRPPGRDRPGGRAAQGGRGDGGGDRARGPALRGAADRGHGRSRRRGPTCGWAPTTGPRRSTAAGPASRTTRRATRCGRRWSTILVDKCDGDVPVEQLGRALARNEALVDAFGGAWPRLDPADLVGDLWSVPAYLRRCAPWLSADEVRDAAARGPAGLDGVRPAAARRRPAAARRPGGLAPAAPAGGRAGRAARGARRASSTT